MTRGRFITLEGGEGAGKSVQRDRLVAALRAVGIGVVATREPGGSPSAEVVRDVLLAHGLAWQPLSEALLHAAARAQHLVETIRPALADGHWVVSDRFNDSTRAYQGAGQGVPAETLDQLDRMVVGDSQPDLTLILDVPAEVGLARAQGRGQGSDRYEAMDLSFHERLRASYRAIAKAEPERCVLIDATGDLEAVATAVRAAVQTRLGVAL
ncbi:dTMP kinase [Rhodovibrio salinarum]|uniref:Thymidylate kinase n=1 Tax=Rhodovibrio salinarum TaxID=1087 RepID=A0A934QJ59_9PROT|nr:dTMP kinase [Rhodovibrio salinarum]MBK1697988.1 dTMP kinase [Rhodovibrio salinarum]